MVRQVLVAGLLYLAGGSGWILLGGMDLIMTCPKTWNDYGNVA